MFRETVETGGLHSEELYIMNEPHPPQSTCNGLSGETLRGFSGIIEDSLESYIWLII